MVPVKTAKKGKTKAQAKRLSEAAHNLKEIEKMIAPFVKQRQFRKYSTDGKWCETSNLDS